VSRCCRVPGVVGSREVELHAGCPLDLCVAVKFGSVVGRDCLDPSQVTPQESSHALVDGGDGTVGEFADGDFSCGAVNQGYDAVLAPCAITVSISR